MKSIHSEATITIEGGADVIDLTNLTIRSPKTVGLLRELEPERLVGAVLDLIDLGADVRASVVQTAEANLVDATMGKVDLALEHLATTAVAKASEAGTATAAHMLQGLTAPGGPLAKALEVLDPSSRRYVIAEMRDAMATTFATAIEEHRALVRKDVKAVVDDLAAEVRRELGTMNEQLAAQAASKQMYDKTTMSGLAYEDVVETTAGMTIKGNPGETIEAVGTLAGSDGNKLGDFVLETPWGRIVIEAKKGRVSKPQMLAEAKGAMSNRDADYCVWVTTDADHVPGKTVLAALSDNVLAVVLDNTDPDPTAFEVAIAKAKADLTLLSMKAHDGTSNRVLHDALDQTAIISKGLAETIKRFTSVKCGHGLIQRGLTQATDGLEAVRTDLQDLVGQLQATVSNALESNHERGVAA